jgi:hypothetical protein
MGGKEKRATDSGIMPTGRLSWQMGEVANDANTMQSRASPGLLCFIHNKIQNLSRVEVVWTRLAISPVLTLVGQSLLHISPLAFLTIMSMI